MKTIYRAFSEEAGEVEGMFDENGELLGIWSCNDASWRNEYFSPFMKRLGITIERATPEMEQRLYDKANEMWGPFEEY